MVSKTFLVVSLLLTSFHGNGPVLAAQTSSVEPVWHTTLGVDFKARLGVVLGKSREYRFAPKTSVWFTNNDTIAVTFVMGGSADRPQLSHRADLSNENSTLRLRALFIDAANGKITASPDWPCSSRYASIVAAYDGKFVTQTGIQLILYDHELNQLKKLRLPELKEYEWGALPSPTGRNILFVPTQLKGDSWLWVDAESLQMIRSWTETRSGYVAISDEKLAMITCIWSSECTPEVKIRSLSTDWETIMTGQKRMYLQFVDQDILFISGPTKKFIRMSGEIVYEDRNHTTEGCGRNLMLSTADGRRLVIPNCETKGAIRSLDIGGNSILKSLLVYDLLSQVHEFNLNVKGPRIQGQMQFALSPDGSKLAVLNGETVQLFQLPLSH
jgi:hypothetical protein